MSTQLFQTPYCLRYVRIYSTPSPARNFSSKTILFSGHNKWAKIKHDKAKEDAGKSKQRSALTSEIRTIAKLHGPDPSTNPRLATLIATAKKSGLPKATLEGAIARGAGKSPSGASLESLTIEAMLPSSVAAIIECQTDNKARTLSDIRYIIKDFGGTVTPTNHLFERMGKVVLQGRDDVLGEDVEMDAIEAGCTDFESTDDGIFIVYTEPQETASVADAIVKSAGLQVLSTDIIWAPKEETKVEGSPSGPITEFVNKLENDPSVQSIFFNLDRRMANPTPDLNFPSILSKRNGHPQPSPFAATLESTRPVPVRNGGHSSGQIYKDGVFVVAHPIEYLLPPAYHQNFFLLQPPSFRTHCITPPVC